MNEPVAISAPSRPPVHDRLPLDRDLLKRIHELMVEARCLEERLIQMYKQGHGYFWMGGPGEEAFNVPLGLLMKRGQGPGFDYLHAHYRQSATLCALGEDPVGALRQMKNTASDPYSGGRNFVAHYSKRSWNIVPVTSPIEVQYTMAAGTALAQKRFGGEGITIVTGGDAGSAEGDFATCLAWTTRPGNELPVLMVVTHNQWGISTAAHTQHGEVNISDRGRAFGMRTRTINGNDPVESYFELNEAMAYVRRERRPFLIETHVSRLHGHSSATGANLARDEVDCLAEFEGQLELWGLLTRPQMAEVRERWTRHLADLARQVTDEPLPSAESIWRFIYRDRE